MLKHYLTTKTDLLKHLVTIDPERRDAEIQRRIRVVTLMKDDDWSKQVAPSTMKQKPLYFTA